MDRLQCNLDILNMLEIYALKHPYLRFHQLLQNIGIIDIKAPDKFNEESKTTLIKLLENPNYKKVYLED